MPRWINRAAIVVRPGRPYIEWASRLDDEAPQHAKDPEKRFSIYLVSEDSNETEETAPLDHYFKKIFEAELAAWWTNEADWPKDRTLQMFLEWFYVARESIVTDLESGPIEHDEV